MVTLYIHIFKSKMEFSLFSTYFNLKTESALLQILLSQTLKSNIEFFLCRTDEWMDARGLYLEEYSTNWNCSKHICRLRSLFRDITRLGSCKWYVWLRNLITILCLKVELLFFSFCIKMIHWNTELERQIIGILILYHQSPFYDNLGSSACYSS